MGLSQVGPDIASISDFTDAIGSVPALVRCTPMASENERAADKAHVKLAKSATHLEQSADQQTDSADRRTQLAADRTVLAAERTYAAWVRTGLAALAAGIGARALLDKIVASWLITLTGTVLILFSGICFVAAVWRQMGGVSPPRPDTRRIPPVLLVAVNGFLTLVSLATLAGIWLH